MSQDIATTGWLAQANGQGGTAYAITIDRSRCKKDGICSRVCAKGICVQREKLTVPEGGL